MPTREIEEFAAVLLREVRDRSISSCDNLLAPHAKNVVATRWRQKLENGLCEELAKAIIPDCVDNVLFYLLYAIDSGVLRLSFTASDGAVVDLSADGEAELAGWYMGTDAWRAAYSQERFVDDFEDLA